MGQAAHEDTSYSTQLATYTQVTAITVQLYSTASGVRPPYIVLEMFTVYLQLRQYYAHDHEVA